MKTNPNAVIFKRDDGQLIVIVRKDGEWDWENVLHLNMDEMKDKFDDLSASNPFEWVFCNWGEKEFTTTSQKTIIPNQSFSKMFEANTFKESLKVDYETQYGKDSV